MNFTDNHIVPRTYHFYDWTCPICNFFIYGNKEFCKKCLTRNPKLPKNVNAKTFKYYNK